MTPKNVGSCVDLPSPTRYVDDWLRFPRNTFMHYVNGMCRIVVAVNSPMRFDALSCMNIFGTGDSKCYIRHSLWNERRRTATPIDEFSCWFMWCVLVLISHQTIRRSILESFQKHSFTSLCASCQHWATGQFGSVTVHHCPSIILRLWKQDLTIMMIRPLDDCILLCSSFCVHSCGTLAKTASLHSQPTCSQNVLWFKNIFVDLQLYGWNLKGVDFSTPWFGGATATRGGGGCEWHFR